MSTRKEKLMPFKCGVGDKLIYHKQINIKTFFEIFQLHFTILERVGHYDKEKNLKRCTVSRNVTE